MKIITDELVYLTTGMSPHYLLLYNIVVGLNTQNAFIRIVKIVHIMEYLVILQNIAEFIKHIKWHQSHQNENAIKI